MFFFINSLKLMKIWRTPWYSYVPLGVHVPKVGNRWSRLSFFCFSCFSVFTIVCFVLWPRLTKSCKNIWMYSYTSFLYSSENKIRLSSALSTIYYTFSVVKLESRMFGSYFLAIKEKAEKQQTKFNFSHSIFG